LDGPGFWDYGYNDIVQVIPQVGDANRQATKHNQDEEKRRSCLKVIKLFQNNLENILRNPFL